jgi:hypothetical protein
MRLSSPSGNPSSQVFLVAVRQYFLPTTAERHFFGQEEAFDPSAHIRLGDGCRQIATEALDHHTFPFSYPKIDSSSSEALLSFCSNERTS